MARLGHMEARYTSNNCLSFCVICNEIARIRQVETEFAREPTWSGPSPAQEYQPYFTPLLRRIETIYPPGINNPSTGLNFEIDRPNYPRAAVWTLRDQIQ